MKIVRRALWGVFAVVLLFALAVLALRNGAGASDRAELEERWADTPSRFVMVDGVRVHVREEGPEDGPVIVLLHGSIVSLHEWDAVTDLLKDRYRVVRFDWSPYGLTGPDPTNEYSTERAAELMKGLMDQLGHDRFVMVATSNGANVGLEFNRAYPGHVTAMALSILPLERPSQTRKVDWRLRYMGAVHKAVLPNWRSRWFWRLVVADTTPPGFTPDDRMIDAIYDMNNLPGALERQAAYIQSNVRLFQSSDVGAIAETVTVPVLLQWCAVDDVISQGPQASVARFTNAPLELIEYSDLGHFPMWEDPERFTRDMVDWLSQVEQGQPMPESPAGTGL